MSCGWGSGIGALPLPLAGEGRGGGASASGFSVWREPPPFARVGLRASFARLDPASGKGFRERGCCHANMASHSRHALRPRFAFRCPSSKVRGRREDRVLAAPAVSRAICANKYAHEHTGQRETLRPSLRNGFTAYFVLSPENGSFASVAAQKLPRNLAPAPRRPNHTTSPYAQATHVSRSSRVHRISPRVRDDGQRPSSAARRAKLWD
jgi:hypothetical protein